TRIKENKNIEKCCMMVVGQVCPHCLVVEDISISRRQRGFDFPWGSGTMKRS
ncbi:uncharacterized protein LOC132800523, partial [Ziziphus jujuba]|uniref:Uncharacterized protein LOC132800523 n=1 Tax=Ziziphus jujuba TaxID=326968 RepID=A0ABM4A128_ZIZJJ